MSKYASLEELAEKIDWEGGLEEFLHYGFDPYEDLPEGSDDQLIETASTMLYKWREFREWADYFEAALPENYGDNR